MTILVPRPARASAVSRPIHFAAPVIRAVLPFKFPGFSDVKLGRKILLLGPHKMSAAVIF